MTSVIRSTIGLLLSGCSLAAAAAESPGVLQPALQVGDSWVFDQTDERGPNEFGETRLDLAVERLDGDTMMVGVKRDGSPGGYEDHMVGQDWSLRRVIDGQEATTTRPLTFPMSVGQSWTIDFIDPTPRGQQRSLHVHRTYKVMDWEDVTTPAGSFHAIKIVAKGVDKATIQVANAAVGGIVGAPGSATTVTHTQRGGQGDLTRETYGEFYYVPRVKTWVKSVEEQYNTDNVRLSRETRTLVSYKTSG